MKRELLLPSTKDSAGMTIYSYAEGAFEATSNIPLPDKPFFTIGSDNPDEDVSGMGSGPIVVLSDGRIVGYDWNAGTLSVFGDDGRLEKTFGGRGSGPGEFGRVDGMYLLGGDSLVISDQANARISIVHPDSGVVGSFRAPLVHGLAWYSAEARTDSAGWLLIPTSFGPPDDRTRRPSIPVLRMPESGGLNATLDTTASVPGLLFSEIASGPDAGGLTPPVFAPYPNSAAGPKGAVAVTNDDFDLVWFGNDGTVRAALRAGSAQELVEPQLVDSVVAVTLAQRLEDSEHRGNRSAEELENGLRARPYLDVLPRFGKAFLAPNGTLWLQHYPISGVRPETFTAVGPNGVLLGQLTIDNGKESMAFGNDRVVLRLEDPVTGVITFEVYPLNFDH